MGLQGRDLITTQEWTQDELIAALDLAVAMKKDRYGFTHVLRHRTFNMLFYNPSVRTRGSFECAATELGGHAQFLEPRAMRLKTASEAGETVEDVAQVMSRYACGIGIRITEDAISRYGEGEALLREYARWADVPVVSMAHDKFHPCQGLADLMGWIEWLSPRGEFRTDALAGRKLLVTWGHGALARSWPSVHEAMLVASRFGMTVTVAAPEGYDLDPEVIEWTRGNCAAHGAQLETINHSRAGYENAHIVLSRNWLSPDAYRGGEFHKQAEIDGAMKLTDWICDASRMALTDDAIFSHPMPVDRGHEVTDEVASGERSCIYDVAENRVHVQKAVMALTMGSL